MSRRRSSRSFDKEKRPSVGQYAHTIALCHTAIRIVDGRLQYERQLRDEHAATLAALDTADEEAREEAIERADQPRERADTMSTTQSGNVGRAAHGGEDGEEDGEEDSTSAAPALGPEMRRRMREDAELERPLLQPRDEIDYLHVKASHLHKLATIHFSSPPAHAASTHSHATALTASASSPAVLRSPARAEAMPATPGSALSGGVSSPTPGTPGIQTGGETREGDMYLQLAIEAYTAALEVAKVGPLR